jgi:F-type H+-transporting ATPase subunit b
LELSWSTFVLEIVNFLVLVWILTRFLYRPVLDVIAKRRGDIEKKLADARDLESTARDLQAKYENRLAEWETERRNALEKLNGELAEERKKQLASLQSELEHEREKSEVSEARRLDATRRQIEETALAQGARFTARLLGQLAGPDLDARLFDLLLDRLAALPPERAAALAHQNEKKITVGSAFPLSDEQRSKLSDALAQIAGTDSPIAFEQNDELLAGVRVTIGAFSLGMNLKDELNGFVESTNDKQEPL